jgi:hypothetical protein
MNTRLMLLPSEHPQLSQLFEVPEDYQEQEAFRHVTGIIAAVEEQQGTIEDIIEALEARGFRPIEFSLGPALPQL